MPIWYDGYTCEYEGVGQYDGSYLVVEDVNGLDDNPVKILIHDTKTLEIVERCEACCGMGASILGIYNKL